MYIYDTLSSAYVVIIPLVDGSTPAYETIYIFQNCTFK